ncbi:hypothetical protein JXA85_00250 [Candidatus Woesearchaeota archaeon]|nr:hypothetical protein [Candidatus Woesearchaeota archaeon]
MADKSLDDIAKKESEKFHPNAFDVAGILLGLPAAGLYGTYLGYKTAVAAGYAGLKAYASMLAGGIFGLAVGIFAYAVLGSIFSPGFRKYMASKPRTKPATT